MTAKQKLQKYESLLVPLQDQPTPRLDAIARRLKMNEDLEVQAVGEFLRRAIELMEQH